MRVKDDSKYILLSGYMLLTIFICRLPIQLFWRGDGVLGLYRVKIARHKPRL